MPTSINLNASQTTNLNTVTQKTESASGVSGKAQVSERVQSNASILQASLEVSISAGDDSMTLLYKSAIESLNEILAPEFGENAIENAASQDNSPEATADRIVSLSTGFYEAYKAQHPEQDATSSLESFMELIQSGFEKGYQEAVDILEGLKVFEGDIAAGIEKTYELVQQGYADFQQTQSDLIAALA